MTETPEETRARHEANVNLLTWMTMLAREGDYAALDGILVESRPRIPELSELDVLVLLRGTFRFRSQMTGWDTFRDEAAAELTRRGANTKKLLMGLLDPEPAPPGMGAPGQ